MKCSRCKKTKKRLIPYSKLLLKNGTLKFYYYCRACNTARCIKYKQTKIGREKINQAAKRSYRKHKEKQRARQILNYYLVQGKIKRKPCWCGKKAEAHHPDYSQALLVDWLCRTHHADLHRKLKV